MFVLVPSPVIVAPFVADARLVISCTPVHLVPPDRLVNCRIRAGTTGGDRILAGFGPERATPWLFDVATGVTPPEYGPT